jgi:hypothetical protein
MNRTLQFLMLGMALTSGAALAAKSAVTWQPTTWQGERALVSISHGWRAVVSLERGRLIHFGPADRELNLLFAPLTRDDRNAWGGHRLWLGPQSTWTQIWPPPEAWENSGPESFTVEGDVLRMHLRDAGDGWPRLTRTYRWDGAKLVCDAESSGGSRSAQIIHIIQVPASTVATAEARPEENLPAGYVKLPFNAHGPERNFASPPHVSRTGDLLSLRQAGGIEKLGFHPQTLVGRAGTYELRLGRGAQHGLVTGNLPPDQGFFTQVYLSQSGAAFIELEQLSPLCSAEKPASFSIVLEGAAIP